MKTTEKTVREPLFHLVTRSDISRSKGILIRIIAICVALIISGLIALLLANINPIEFYKALVNGAFGSGRRIWKLFHNLAILLCISLAVTPAFKMQFWNIGAEGQVLVGGLATCACMFYLGGKMPNWLLYIVMIAASVIAGIIWAVIPAIFKAKWNTNETLFTLMMNYVAIQLVSFSIDTWVTSGSGTLPPMSEYGLPTVANDWLLNIITVTVVTAFMYIYLKFSKHGYEISVVGESQNTARYIGINVKKVIVRTMVLSGVICGISGLLLVGGTDHSITTDTVGGQGFTAIMVSWLAKFNPLTMILTAFLIVFLQAGSKQVSTTFNINDSISDIITAIIILFIIGCEFFINYKIMFRKTDKEVK